ncbi:hypothetical protein VCR5J5_1370003 [Vibrio crassostreae]|uniref:Uncharacterized protein n=1 Tax=Vibrio crassostreae TaxID=246167 RepID=A0A822MSH0_9VIBR|nr:hypothetical protein VCR5J5_1370003 [Vibrio crassostreae]
MRSFTLYFTKGFPIRLFDIHTNLHKVLLFRVEHYGTYRTGVTLLPKVNQIAVGTKSNFEPKGQTTVSVLVSCYIRGSRGFITCRLVSQRL